MMEFMTKTMEFKSVQDSPLSVMEPGTGTPADLTLPSAVLKPKLWALGGHAKAKAYAVMVAVMGTMAVWLFEQPASTSIVLPMPEMPTLEAFRSEVPILTMILVAALTVDLVAKFESEGAPSQATDLAVLSYSCYALSAIAIAVCFCQTSPVEEVPFEEPSLLHLMFVEAATMP